jgi:hypothetical protein
MAENHFDGAGESFGKAFGSGENGLGLGLHGTPGGGNPRGLVTHLINLGI